MILITGGTGYIGNIIAHKLYEHNYSIITIDTKPHTTTKFKTYTGNINDESLLKLIFQQNKITHVIHCAAYTNVTESMSNPMKYYTNNINNSITLLKIMEEFMCHNIIFSSSCSVYGYGVPEIESITETTSTLPINIYWSH